MRRLLLSVLLCLPTLAEARGLVVVSRVRNSAFSAAIAVRQERQADYSERLALDLLDRFKVDYKVALASQVKTEFARTGAMVWNYGTVAATVEQFDWVLHVSYPGKLAKSGRWLFPNYRPDSLHISALGGCTVPQLFWNMQLNSATPNAFLADTTGDTTGFAVGTVGLEMVNSCQFPLYVVSHTGHRFLESSYIGVPAPGTPSTPSGGIRMLLGRRAGSTNLTTGMEQAMFIGDASFTQTMAWADSAADLQTDRTVSAWQVWEMPFDHISTAKPLVFAQVWGISGCTDSSGVAGATPCEWDTQNAIYSLARLDSLTSGDVFGRTLGLGVVIRGGFKYANVGSNRGISPADTTALWGTLDSLATLGSRFRCVVTVDMDSVWARPSHKSQWGKLPAVRYAPTAEACVYDSTAGQCRGGTGTKWLWPIDVFGRQRKRAAYGDGTAGHAAGAPSSADADSSVYAGVKSLFFHADSTFGRDRVSRLLVPPGDDWTPLFNAGGKVDSVLYAFGEAGAVGLLFNSQRRTTPSESRGSWDIGEERVMNLPYSGKPFLLLGHSGIAVNGGRRSFDVRADSTDWGDGVCQDGGGAASDQYTFASMAAYEVHRAINQLVFPRYRDFDLMPNRWPDDWDDVNTPADDRTYGIRRGSVWMTSANELGGGGHLAAGYAATRPAWWTIKSLDQFMLAVNKQAGRTVIRWEWPEHIRP